METSSIYPLLSPIITCMYIRLRDVWVTISSWFLQWRIFVRLGFSLNQINNLKKHLNQRFKSIIFAVFLSCTCAFPWLLTIALAVNKRPRKPRRHVRLIKIHLFSPQDFNPLTFEDWESPKIAAFYTLSHVSNEDR